MNTECGYILASDETLRLYKKFPLEHTPIEELGRSRVTFAPRYDLRKDTEINSTFLQDHKNSIFILHNAAEWWPSAKWTPDTFREMDAEIEISLCVEESMPTRKIRSSMSSFIDSLNQPGFRYLKEMSMDKLPKLRDQLNFREWSNSRFGRSYLWIGSGNCRTGLHDDDENNIVLQVYGHKRFLLYPPNRKNKLHPNSKYDIGTTCYDDDLRTFSDPIVAILQPGDLLFFPKSWPHQAESLDISISVNHFYSNCCEWFTGLLKREFYDFLHDDLGWWKHNCVCHS